MRRIDIKITGVAGGTLDLARFQTTLHIHDPINKRRWITQAYVLQSIEIVTPSGRTSSDTGPLKRDLQLADPNFDEPRKVDLILGADVQPLVILLGLRRLERLLAQRTIFGWTLIGCLSAAGTQSSANCYATRPDQEVSFGHEELLHLMQRFWALEDVPHIRRVSSDDAECEMAYSNFHTWNSSGRYVVPLPLKRDGVQLLGASLSRAHTTLSSMHRRMQKDPDFLQHYRLFMREYETHGHMRLLTDDEIRDVNVSSHYLTHHGIWQKSDHGRKLRVVFNASRPTASGHSLNDALHAGPKLQGHIASIIARWRCHRYVFCTDVQMMFRQILIREDDIHLQRILWSPSAEEPIRHYVLLTVTYGTACAPYLALRTIKQLCADEGDRFPRAAASAAQELYMDDFLCGSHDLPSTKILRDQLIGLLKAGGFRLRKWVANDASLLEGIPAEDLLRPSWVQFSDGPVNELGVTWNPVTDEFTFRLPPPEEHPVLTKRRALAELARIFDPVGWLAPLTLLAKLVIQDLWRAQFTWDEPLPRPWTDRWRDFQNSIGQTSSLSIPRWLGCRLSDVLELHAFSDASRRAMAAVLYSRAEHLDAGAQVTLLCARTRLNSIKSLKPTARTTGRMTIPRLELRAALIAARLLKSTAETLDVPLTRCHFWSDSRVALHWIQSDGPIGSDLVDNYVSHIQELSAGATWHHVGTNDNPADVASRGCSCEALSAHPLWWTGPTWLSQSPSSWPNSTNVSDTPEVSVATLTVGCPATRIQPEPDHTERFSSLDALLRGTVRSRRLLRQATRGRLPSARPLEPVTPQELRQAFLTCSRLSQLRSFTDELCALRNLQPVLHRSPLRPLGPFLDNNGILRVGGRLENALLTYDEKHPVILDGRDHLATLVIRWAHERSLHASFRATYGRVLQRAWIIGGKSRVKRYLRGCVVCQRLSARTVSQQMAPLPAARVVPSRPFAKTGLDYAGPFQVHRTKGRGLSTSKGYVAVFVCMSSKAIHLELVGDLTTASFLGALTRFIARRGRPAEIWSDNATTFHGADAELQRLLKASSLDWGLIENQLSPEGIQWKFIPPGAPHFGGLWEAGVKSMKAHLQRVAGPRRLVYEEFATLLCSIEMVLNSRPLTPPIGDLGDLEALTPGHLLTGTSSVSFPQPADAEASLEHSSHWDLVKAMRDHFWARWSREYLNTLAQRPKWQRPQPNLAVGDFVVVTDPSLLRPDGRWPLGRVTEVHPGKDGLVRAVTIRTAYGQYTRPVVKVAPLPVVKPIPADVNSQEAQL